MRWRDSSRRGLFRDWMARSTGPLPMLTRITGVFLKLNLMAAATVCCINLELKTTSHLMAAGVWTPRGYWCRQRMARFTEPQILAERIIRAQFSKSILTAAAIAHFIVFHTNRRI